MKSERLLWYFGWPPYFFNGNVTGITFLNMLQSELPEMLEVVNPNIIQRMWIQQDGTPPHFARIVTNILYLTYGQRWIGRDGYVAWPLRSPDLTTPDSFVGVSKECRVSEDTYYAGKYQGAHKTSIPATMLRKTIDAFERRLYLCIDQNSGTIELLL